MTLPYDDYKMYGSTPSGRSRSYAYYVTSKKPGGFQYHVSCSVIGLRVGLDHNRALRKFYAQIPAYQ